MAIPRSCRIESSYDNIIIFIPVFFLTFFLQNTFRPLSRMMGSDQSVGGLQVMIPLDLCTESKVYSCKNLIQAYFFHLSVFFLFMR